MFTSIIQSDCVLEYVQDKQGQHQKHSISLYAKRNMKCEIISVMKCLLSLTGTLPFEIGNIEPIIGDVIENGEN